MVKWTIDRIGSQIAERRLRNPYSSFQQQRFLQVEKVLLKRRRGQSLVHKEVKQNKEPRFKDR